MRILIVSHYFPPLNLIASYRPYSWAKYWNRAGHDVTVLTTPKGQSQETDKNEGFRTVEIEIGGLLEMWQRIRARWGPPSNGPPVPGKGVTTVYEGTALGTLAAKINSFLVGRGLFLTSRMPDLTDGWVKPATRWAEGEDKWDLVVSTYGPYSTHLIAMKLRQQHKAGIWVADYRDLWTEHHEFRGLFPFTALEEVAERRVMNLADVVVTVSKPLAEQLERKYGRTADVIENGFDSEDLQSLRHDAVFPDDGKVRIIHTGTIYPDKQNIEPLLSAIAAIEREPHSRPLLDRLEVLFCGNHLGNLGKLVDRHGVSKWVKNLGSLPRETALRMQRDAHVLLFLDWDSEQTDGILTGKLFEYLASGTPIWSIGTYRVTTAGALIAEARAGRSLGRDVGAIKSALIQLLKTGIKEPALGDRSVTNRFERKALAERLLLLVETRMASGIPAGS